MQKRQEENHFLIALLKQFIVKEYGVSFSFFTFNFFEWIYKGLFCWNINVGFMGNIFRFEGFRAVCQKHSSCGHVQIQLVCARFQHLEESNRWNPVIYKESSTFPQNQTRGSRESHVRFRSSVNDMAVSQHWKCRNKNQIKWQK